MKIHYPLVGLIALATIAVAVLLWPHAALAASLFSAHLAHAGGGMLLASLVVPAPADLGQLAQKFDVGVAELKQALEGDREKLQKLDQLLTSHTAEITELSQKMARRGGGGFSGQDPAETAGSIVAKSDKLQAFVSDRVRGKLSIQVKSLTSAIDSAGSLVAPDRQSDVAMLARRPHTIRDLLNAKKTTSGSIEYQRQTLRTNNAAPVSEGAQKPQSLFEFEAAEAKVVTIAHWTKASRQVLADAPQLQELVDGELRYGLKDKEEQQLLYGTGTGQDLEGMVTVATAYSAPFVMSGGSMIDKLRLAMLQARLAFYPVTGFVLHPTDWARIETTKDDEGRYIIGDPKAGGGATLWGKPVVECDSIEADKFLTGAFGLASQLFDREEAEVIISTEDGDNFTKNMVTLLCEERLTLVNRRPEALVYGDFGNVA